MVIDASEVLSVIKKPSDKQSAKSNVASESVAESAPVPENSQQTKQKRPGEPDSQSGEGGASKKSSDGRGRGRRKGRKK